MKFSRRSRGCGGLHAERARYAMKDGAFLVITPCHGNHPLSPTSGQVIPPPGPLTTWLGSLALSGFDDRLVEIGPAVPHEGSPCSPRRGMRVVPVHSRSQIPSTVGPHHIVPVPCFTCRVEESWLGNSPESESWFDRLRRRSRKWTWLSRA